MTHPPVAWAQRPSWILLTVEAKNAQDVLMEFRSPKHFGMSFVTANPRKVFSFEFAFYESIDPPQCSYAVLDLVIEVKLRKAFEAWWPYLVASKNQFLKVDWKRFVEEGSPVDDDCGRFGIAASVMSTSRINIVEKLNEALPALPTGGPPPPAKHTCRASYPHLIRVQFQDLQPVILPGSVCRETKGLFMAIREGGTQYRTVYPLCEAFYEDHTCGSFGECMKIHVEPREVRNYFGCYVCKGMRGEKASSSVPM